MTLNYNSEVCTSNFILASNGSSKGVTTDCKILSCHHMLQPVIKSVFIKYMNLRNQKATSETLVSRYCWVPQPCSEKSEG